ncbi:MAG: tetratricopeptide repeat protein [Thermoanaerobaculia bacterium]
MKAIRLGRASSLWLVISAILGAAGSLDASPPAWRLELAEQVRRQGLSPDEIVFPAVLSEEMKAWLKERVRRDGPPPVVLDQVLQALLDSKDLQLQYESGYTATAEEAFVSGRANCLAFTQLFVSMTRELGLPTYYVNVVQIERYRREGDLVVVSGHVTAAYGAGSERRILEFGAVYQPDYRKVRRISDLNALARYYSNRGAERLRDGAAEEALEWSRTAVALDPTLADAWVNLGVARRRSGDLAGAEAAYRQAVEVDADHLPAFHNLSLLLRLRGETDAAQQILRLLDRRDNHNPFIYLDLGDSSAKAGRLNEARRFYRRALRLGGDLAEPRAAQGLWALQRGDEARARKWLRRARAIDPDDARTLELARRLAELVQGRARPDRHG